jgi:hypothetical protein
MELKSSSEEAAAGEKVEATRQSKMTRAEEVSAAMERRAQEGRDAMRRRKEEIQMELRRNAEERRAAMEFLLAPPGRTK